MKCDRNFACFWPPIFWGRAPRIFGVNYKIDTGSDHVAKFRVIGRGSSEIMRWKKGNITSILSDLSLLLIIGRDSNTPCPFFRPPVRSNGRTYKMLVMFFLFRHAFSEVPRPIALKLGHMVGNCLNFIIQVQKFGALSKKIWGQKHANFRSILYNLRLWSRISPERLKISKIGELIFPDRFLLRSTEKVWWTLVH